MLTIPCSIGGKVFARAMLDSGSSINVMPYSVYETLELPPLSKTNVVIQLADRSTIHPKGLVEDVVVEVDKFIFPADFYVLDIEPDSKATPLLLGRPFMRTYKTKLDMYDGNLTMEFEGKILKYNVYETMKKADDLSFCYFLDVIEPLANRVYQLSHRDPLEVALTNNIEKESLRFLLSHDVQKSIEALEKEEPYLRRKKK
ncbi:uncharacterized protein LOC141620544 [Silene latifolia]|uniref:uncharacterized protein LOC141620544 n=1 Tax=Silene latifolia TaxID=37657 RepID=UPI003D77EBD4